MLFEYRCRDCKHRFEEYRPWGERKHPAPCHRCPGTGEIVPAFGGISGRAKAPAASPPQPAPSSPYSHREPAAARIRGGNLTGSKIVGNGFGGAGIVIQGDATGELLVDRNWINAPVAIKNSTQATVKAEGNRHSAERADD